MKKFYKIPVLYSVCVALSLSSRVTAETVEWVTSNEQQQWVTKPSMTTIAATDIPAGTAIYEITPDSLRQEIIGWGGCFNEKGWTAMKILSDAGRDSIMQALFSPAGCAFDFCRMAVGASDYAEVIYSFDDHDGDYTMQYFNLGRDTAIMIPYIKAALNVNPKMTVWGCPWQVPSWMSRNGVFATPNMWSAFALYFSKYVQAYEQKGITVSGVSPMNEPCNGSGGGGVNTQFTDEQMRTFIRDHLGPRLEQDKIKAKIWLAGVNCEYDPWMALSMNDPNTSKYIYGVGVQWAGTGSISTIHKNHPDKMIMQSEGVCGDGKNNWSYGWSRFSEMRTDFNNGANAFMQWNMVLDTTGKSITGWFQNGMVTVNQTNKQVKYTPQFTVVKHYSHFVRTGARMCKSTTATTPISAIAFRNPNSDFVIVGRTTAAQTKMALKIGQKAVIVEAPAGIHTFIFRNSTGVGIYGHKSPLTPLLKIGAAGGNRMQVRFSVPAASLPLHVSIGLFDIHGRFVSAVHDGAVLSGEHTVSIETRLLAKGFFICRMKTGTFEKSIGLLIK